MAATASSGAFWALTRQENEDGSERYVASLYVHHPRLRLVARGEGPSAELALEALHAEFAQLLRMAVPRTGDGRGAA